jgi:hypothetical protein
MSCDSCDSCKNHKNVEKSSVVGRLLEQDNFILYGVHHSPPGRVKMIIHNKPDQMLLLDFIPFDTWNVIKNKVEKLVNSDGICVVCMEREKGIKKIEKRRCGNNKNREILTPSWICDSCCEFVCKKCCMAMEGNKCPVCRKCLMYYQHKMKNEECDLSDSE